jgi:hypothetical protein
MVDRCRRIYHTVRTQGSAGCLGSDYHVYYVDLRQVAVTAALTPPQYDDGHGLPPGVTVARMFTDEETGTHYSTLESLMEERLRRGVQELLDGYFVKESPATGEAVKAGSLPLVLDMIVKLAPQVAVLIEKHRVK